MLHSAGRETAGHGGRDGVRFVPRVFTPYCSQTNNSFLRGAVLGEDGHTYLIPSPLQFQPQLDITLNNYTLQSVRQAGAASPPLQSVLQVFNCSKIEKNELLGGCLGEKRSNLRPGLIKSSDNGPFKFKGPSYYQTKYMHSALTPFEFGAKQYPGVVILPKE